LLDLCAGNKQWSEDLLDRAIAEDSGRALFSVVVERLGDLFEPRLCDVYDRLMSDVIARVAPELQPRLRIPSAKNPHVPDAVQRVYVLSRITLGADVAVTSVLLDAAKRRFPRAEIVFVGPQKSYELFADDGRIYPFPGPYSRGGTLADRLRASAALWLKDGIVIDPDSRLTQLGLISVCAESDYFFFPSRSFGGEGHERLPDLAARWAQEIFGVEQAEPYIAPEPPEPDPETSEDEAADITVSLGVGENEAKRIGGDFERDLLAMLAETGASLLVDKGGSAAEAARVEKALPPGARTHQGDFAPFAAQIERSKLYVGYDSAGGHVASACGVPVIGIAKGFASDRMAARWKPKGIVLDGNDPLLLHRVKEALSAHWPPAPCP
jgi:ADP-heptose:LPS heptosyltransferase